MANWILIAAAKSLFAAFDVFAPGRAHASDGSIGDAAHAQEVSDHNPDETGSVPIHDADHINEVHAIDVDFNLRTPGLTMEMAVQHILGRCRTGAERRLRYIIYNHRIWEADNAWRQRNYTGASPHTEHAHFSFSYLTPLEASTVSWHLEDIMVELSPGALAKIEAIIDDRINELLKKATPLLGPDGKPDGTTDTPIGKLALSNGIPQRPGEARVPAYALLADIGEQLDQVLELLGPQPA